MAFCKFQFRFYIFIFLFFIFSIKSFGLPVDSLENRKIYKTKIFYFYEKDFRNGKVIQFTPDTNISTVHHVNPALDLHYNFLGISGSASESQRFSTNSRLYTLTSIHSYDLNMLTGDSIKSFRTNKRYTELSYHSGNFKEQQIALTHTQNITRTWNAGLSFDRQGVKDFMNFSNTFRSRFSLFTWYNSPDKKYNLFAHAIWNTIKNGVNGGLLNDSLFDNTNVTNLGIKGLAYQISEAAQREKRKIFSLSQYYDLSKVQKDSSGNVIHKSPSIRLHHQSTFERKTFVYKDENPDSLYYSDFYYGAVTYDSLHSDDLKNIIGVQVPMIMFHNYPALKNSYYNISLEYQHVDYKQRTDSSWNNFTSKTNFTINLDSSEMFFEVAFVQEGFDKGNYHYKYNAHLPKYSFGRLGFSFLKSLSSADLIYRWYDSNNFIWKNSFSKINTLKVGINYDLKKYKFSLHAERSIIDNYVYMNSSAFPDQYNAKINIDQISFVKNFTYRKWHLDNTILYQKTDKEEIIHIPSLVTDQSLYYQKQYFNNALLAAFGLSVNFNSSYYANAFMPATGMFYLQNETKTGGYARFDIFINAQIKSAHLFLKLENAADNIGKRSYYLTPHYPMPGRVLKFGLVWRFWDQ